MALVRPANALPVRPAVSDTAGNRALVSELETNEISVNVPDALMQVNSGALNSIALDNRWRATRADYYAAEIVAGRTITVYGDNGQQYHNNTDAIISAATSGAITTVDLTVDPVSGSGNASSHWISVDFQIDIFPYLNKPDGSINPDILARELTSSVGHQFTTRSYYEGSSFGGGNYEWVAAATGTVDGGSFIDVGAKQIRLLTPETLNAATYGLSPFQTGIQNRDQLQLAVDSGNPVLIHAGNNTIEGDITIGNNETVVEGKGFGATVIDFVNGGFILDSTVNVNLVRWKLADMWLKRRGGVGNVLELKGTSIPASSTDWRANSRWHVQNITIREALGCIGINVSDTYSGAFDNVFVLGCDVGWKFHKIATGMVAANAITVSGGEAQGGRIGVEVDNSAGLTFNSGFAIQGNVEKGIHIRGNNRAISVIGCYFERNGVNRIAGVDTFTEGDCDVRLGGAGLSADFGVTLTGNTHFGTAANAIYIDSGSISVESSTFLGYSSSPIKNNDTTNTAYGRVGETCRKNSLDSIPMVENQSLRFRNESTKKEAVPVTGSWTYTAPDTGAVVTNVGATANAIHTLMPALSGMEMEFYLDQINLIRVVPRAADTFAGASPSDYIQSVVVGSRARVYCRQDGIWLQEITGTWTGPAVAYDDITKSLDGLGEHVDNAAAITAGLLVGDWYFNSTDNAVKKVV